MISKEVIKPLFDREDMNTYIVFTRTPSFIGNLIHKFSKLSNATEEFDHVTMVRQGMQVHMTDPRVKFETFKPRQKMKIYKLRKDPVKSFFRATDMWQRDQQYQRYKRNKAMYDQAYERGDITKEEYEKFKGKKFTYGYAQLLTQPLNLLFRFIPPIRARMQCIEFVMRAVGYVPGDIDKLTVGEGHDRLIVEGYLEYIGDYER